MSVYVESPIFGLGELTGQGVLTEFKRVAQRFSTIDPTDVKDAMICATGNKDEVAIIVRTLTGAIHQCYVHPSQVNGLPCGWFKRIKVL